MKRITTVLYAMALMAMAGCDDSSENETETGMLSVETWGEEYIETGIPQTEFVDGYGITYNTFLVSISDIAVQSGENAAPALQLPEQKVWDLTQTGPFEIGSGEVDAGDYAHTAYTIAPAAAAATAGNASAADVQLMKDNGYSVYVVGSATNGTDTYTFTWGFTTNTVYEPCHSTGTVSEDAAGSIQLTIHGDHLFYDSAVSADPSLRFEDLALADADADGDITPAELSAYLLAPLAYYMVPGDSGVENMWQYLSHMTTTLGHIDGEGHCEITSM
ncbi:MAG: hypothetical protein JXX29_03865 [Deltaproteobacteria bacterium]|nr:hypothetical protein [Deltaproteobacteria bacterium]MBN2670780.1 hypothetical protein [Deltaproteobacteria bacterium]